MAVFSTATILLPREVPYETWSVIACDQYTSQPEYWEQVRKITEGCRSTINLILPESDLGSPRKTQEIEQIHETMEAYLRDDVFQTYENALIYVERTLLNGAVRKGLIGRVDLEAYDYKPGSDSMIRATEKTVEERIPPRMQVRQDAALELPHILLLCDDPDKMLLEPVADQREQLQKLYDFDLMQGGGHIRGWLVSGAQADAFADRLCQFEHILGEKYADLNKTPMLFAVGDGNHSLATAKACYEQLKATHPGEDFSHHPARYALVELENIHDEALVFEPIHRIVTGVDGVLLLEELQKSWCVSGGYPVRWYQKEETGMVYLDPSRSQLCVGVLQRFLDEYLYSHTGHIDYIHGDDTLRKLAQAEGAIGFKLPAMEKSQLFRGVIADGALPRKTFSMGHAQEKRYYLESRKIR